MKEQIRKTEGSSTDSWYGVVDPRKRKRIQDRLAQRARRKRLAQASVDEAEKTVVTRCALLPDTVDTELSRAWDIVVTNPSIGIEDTGSTASVCAQVLPHPSDASSPWSNSPSTSETRSGSATTTAANAGSTLASSSSSLLPTIGTTNRALSLIPYHSAQTYPPLPSDRQYLNASKVDVIGALGICGSFLGMVCGMDFDRSSRPACSIPPLLHPTPLQLITPHYRWIDRLPFPRLRDNLILLANTVKLEELFMDFFTIETFTIDEQRPPWDPKAWRPSAEFREKWGYLFH